MNEVQNWLKGYARLQVTGVHTERFISLIKSKEIIIWDLKPEQDGYSFNIGRRNVRDLAQIRRKTGTKITVREKHGLPYLLFRYRKRKFLILGMVICICFVYYGSRFVWDIQVNGTTYYTEEEIRNRIEERYVTLGTSTSKIDCDELEEHLREDYPDISWISCELIGTQLNVVIKETLDGTETIASEELPQDLVAAKDGTIVEIITRNGTPVKRRGDLVQKGEVLISGTVYIYDDYDEVLETDYVTADGDVIAETEYNYNDSFDMQYYQKEYSGDSHKSWILHLYKMNIPIALPGAKSEHSDAIQETHMLRLGNTYILPIGITTVEAKEYVPVLCEYTEEEARERMQNRLEQYLDDLREKDVEIMENHVTITIDASVCEASGSIVTWERIGYGQPIEVPE